MKTLLGTLMTAVLLVGSGWAQKQSTPVSDLKFTVIKATNGKPIRNAAVILHSLDRDGRQGSGGINLKTDVDGHTAFQGAPYGKLRIQVIARGFQTYGEDFDINQPSHEFEIKLKPPADPYTIYGDQGKKQPPESDKKQ